MNDKDSEQKDIRQQPKHPSRHIRTDSSDLYGVASTEPPPPPPRKNDKKDK